jgi:predicted nucleic acid-binding protein
MTFVMDASITASWCFPDEASPAADRAFVRIAKEKAVVPGHWWFELRNVLLVGERRGRLDARQIRRFLELLRDLDIDVDRAPDEAATFDLARRHALTFYDAAYLELALRHDAIASLDTALVKAASAESVVLV